MDISLVDILLVRVAEVNGVDEILTHHYRSKSAE